jgi:hypothetical protein
MSGLAEASKLRCAPIFWESTYNRVFLWRHSLEHLSLIHS